MQLAFCYVVYKIFSDFKFLVYGKYLLAKSYSKL